MAILLWKYMHFQDLYRRGSFLKLKLKTSDCIGTAVYTRFTFEWLAVQLWELHVRLWYTSWYKYSLCLMVWTMYQNPGNGCFRWHWELATLMSIAYRRQGSASGLRGPIHIVLGLYRSRVLFPNLRLCQWFIQYVSLLGRLHQPSLLCRLVPIFHGYLEVIQSANCQVNSALYIYTSYSWNFEVHISID